MASDSESGPGEITLLGLIAAIAEAWKWFLIVSVTVALAAYLFLSLRAVDYQSMAILRIDETAALLTSPNVLRATIQELDMRSELGPTMDDATRVLSRRISTAVLAPKLTRVSLVGRNANRVQSTLTTIIKNFALQIAPRGEQRMEIERQISANTTTVEQMRKYAQKLTDGTQVSEATKSGSNDAALGYVALLNEIEAKENNIILLQRSLEGLAQADILQAPTLPDEAEASNRLVYSLLAAVAASLGLLLIVLIGEVVRRAPRDALALSDLKRIRNALPFSRRR